LSSQPTFDLKALLADPPKLHEINGQLSSLWRIDDTTCLALAERLKRGMKTLETGAGLSTIIFAANGCEHTCIAPQADLIDRIRDYCVSVSIDTSDVAFVISKSTEVTQQFRRSYYDLVLIDGCHGFPTMLVDFYFAANALRPGGVMIVDDLHIYTCELVARFMESDPGWRVDVKTNRIAVATKLSDTADREWCDQDNVRKWSRWGGEPGPKPSPLTRSKYYLLNISKPLRHRLGFHRK
jgi:hypothetical protein